MPASLPDKPWDARIARWLIRPLQGSSVTPNHLTTVRLAVGLAAVGAFASGNAPNLGAFLFSLSNLLDHTDGELARLTGQMSKAGHIYDLAADAVLHVLLFVSIAIGLRLTGAQAWVLPAGVVAGIAAAAIFHLRSEIESRHGKRAARQPRFGGFEAEDVLYLLPVATLLDGLLPFLIAAAIGAPITALIVSRQFIQLRGKAKTGVNR